MDKQDNTSTVPNDGQTPNDGTSTGQTATPQGQKTTSGSERTPIESLPVDTQEYLKRLLDENKSYRKRAQEQERAAQAAEQARLTEQGQFKQLAEQHEARVKELEPVAQSYSQLAELVSGQIETQIKDWPAELKAFDPGKDAPIEQRLAWLEKSKPLLEKLQQRSAPGNGPNPKPATQTPEDLSKQYEKRLRASGSYFKI